MSNSIIHVVTGCYINNRQELLVVRKRNTTAFMLPGDKPVEGESSTETLKREWLEELGVTPEGSLGMLGRFQANAANERGYQARAAAYLIHHIGNESLNDDDKVSDNNEISCAAEIEEFRWLPLLSLKDFNPNLPELAPLLKNGIAPILIQRYQHLHP